MEKQAADLRAQRTAFESERARIMALQDDSSVAVTQLAEKNSRIEALLVSRADAEARANAKSSELHLLQCHSRRIQHELELLQQELVANSTGTSLGAASNGTLVTLPQMVDGSAEEVVHLRKHIVKLAQSSRMAQCRAQELQDSLDSSQSELRAAKSAEAVASAEAAALRESVQTAQGLLREAEGSLDKVHGQMDEYKLALKHANTEIRCLQDSLAATKAARDEAIATACALTSRPPASVSSPCDDVTRTKQAKVRMDMPGADDSECSASQETEHVAPRQHTIDSSVAHIGQRLEMLEMEEAELQEEYAVFQRKLLQQRTALQYSLVEGGCDDSRIKCMTLAQPCIANQSVSPPLNVITRKVMDSAQQTTSTQGLEALFSTFNGSCPISQHPQQLDMPEEAAESHASEVQSHAQEQAFVPEDTTKHVNPQLPAKIVHMANIESATAQNDTDDSRTVPVGAVTSTSSPSRRTLGEIEEIDEEGRTTKLEREAVQCNTTEAVPQTTILVDTQFEPALCPTNQPQGKSLHSTKSNSSTASLEVQATAQGIGLGIEEFAHSTVHNEHAWINCLLVSNNPSAEREGSQHADEVAPVSESSKCSDEGARQQTGWEHDSAPVQNISGEQSLGSSGILEQQSQVSTLSCHMNMRYTYPEV